MWGLAVYRLRVVGLGSAGLKVDRSQGIEGSGFLGLRLSRICCGLGMSDFVSRS